MKMFGQRERRKSSICAQRKIETKLPVIVINQHKMQYLHMKKCVKIDKIPEIVAYNNYTVKRSCDKMDDGWSVTYREGTTWWHDNVAFFDAEKNIWRIYMNNSEPDVSSTNSVRGWRHLDTTYPTCFKGDEEKITEWRKRVLEQLEVLERERLSKTD
jgi:hypothetical protein